MKKKIIKGGVDLDVDFEFDKEDNRDRDQDQWQYDYENIESESGVTNNEGNVNHMSMKDETKKKSSSSKDPKLYFLKLYSSDTQASWKPIRVKKQKKNSLFLFFSRHEIKCLKKGSIAPISRYRNGVDSACQDD